MMLATATGCQNEASARQAGSATEIAQVLDSLETSNHTTERLLDSARLQLDSALQAMVEIASLTDRMAGEPVRVVSANPDELPDQRSDFGALRRRSLARLDGIQRRLNALDASLRTVRDTSQTLRGEVRRLTRMVASLSRGSVAQEARINQMVATLRQVEAERDLALAASERFQKRADTLRDVLEHTVETTRAKDDSVFILIGDATRLQNLGVAERRGGMIGIGRVLSLRGEFPRDAFTVLSKRQVNEVAMPEARREYRLISPQRQACYSWTANADSIAVLRVLDPDCFWESSRYLVIEEKK